MSKSNGCKVCRELLSAGLDLCVRARHLDAISRTEATLSVSSEPEEWLRHGTFNRYVKMHNESNPQAPILEVEGPKCITPTLWAQQKYDEDLFAWENATREHLLNDCPERTGAEIITVSKMRMRKGKKS